MRPPPTPPADSATCSMTGGEGARNGRCRSDRTPTRWGFRRRWLRGGEATDIAGELAVACSLVHGEVLRDVTESGLSRGGAVEFALRRDGGRPHPLDDRRGSVRNAGSAVLSLPREAGQRVGVRGAPRRLDHAGPQSPTHAFPCASRRLEPEDSPLDPRPAVPYMGELQTPPRTRERRSEAAERTRTSSEEWPSGLRRRS
jgi:hypothetical protein